MQKFLSSEIGYSEVTGAAQSHSFRSVSACSEGWGHLQHRGRADRAGRQQRKEKKKRKGAGPGT